MALMAISRNCAQTMIAMFQFLWIAFAPATAFFVLIDTKYFTCGFMQEQEVVKFHFGFPLCLTRITQHNNAKTHTHTHTHTYTYTYTHTHTHSHTHTHTYTHTHTHTHTHIHTHAHTHTLTTHVLYIDEHCHTIINNNTTHQSTSIEYHTSNISHTTTEHTHTTTLQQHTHTHTH